jgi:tetratricopeptide (TPR) repeat protein
MLYLLLFTTLSIQGKSQGDFDNAVKKYYAGELNSAIDLLTKCINNKENLSQAYMYRGAASAFLGRFDEAFKDLQTSFQLDSANDKIYYYMGKAYLLNQQYDLAAGYFKKSILIKSNDPDRFDALATAEISLENYKGAIASETRAIQLDSMQSIFLQNRGFAELKLGYFEKAVRDLSRSLSLDKSYKGYFDRALAYSQMKMYTVAMEDFNASLSIKPDNAEVLYYRGLVLEYMGKTREGCQDFNRSLELGFTDAATSIKVYCK